MTPRSAPEIVVSGGWRAASALAARVGDWYLSPALDAAEAPAKRVELEGEAAAADRRAGFAVGLSLSFSAGSDADLRGGPEAVAGQLLDYGRVGVGLAVLDFADPEADLPVFARQVAPLVNAVGVPAWS